jgi:uncharacterized membrane protein
MKKSLLLSALATALFLSVGIASAADPVQDKAKVQKQEQVYGSQLMTKQERAEYRAKMRAAKTTEEREKIRSEHHEQMQARAKERGVSLPNALPPRGSGMGTGGGMGPGNGRNRQP